MARPYFHSLIEGVDGFIVRLVFEFTAVRDVILPPFTSRVLKTLLYTSECMAALRGLYESRRSFKPVRLSVLRLGGRRLYQTLEDARRRGPLRARAGDVMVGEVSAYTPGDPFEAAAAAGGCRGRLPPPLDALAYEAVEAEVVRVQQLSAGLRAGEPFKLVIHTPLLVDTKVMAPPPLQGRRILRAPQSYRLLPTPSYIAASAARLWAALLRGASDPREASWHAYAIGRLSDVLVAENDYRLQPVTAIYGSNSQGRLKTPRGVRGYVIYTILKDRLAPLLDKLLALAQHLGLGKSRSIGFGEIEVKPAQKKQNTET